MAAPMMGLDGWGTILLALFLVVVVVVMFYKRNTNQQRPPLYKGWIPWVGCAFEFGRSPLTFIHEKQKEHGSVFTLGVAGERITFLMEAEDFDIFFNSSHVDFQKAVQDATNRVASLSKESFFAYHTKIHDTVKGKLSVGNLSALCDGLCQEFCENLQTFTGGEADLMDVVRSSMYRAVITNLFGKNVLPTTDKEGFEQLKNHFVMFDDQFEYGSRLPAIFLRDWSTSKQWLLEKFRSVVKTTNCKKNNILSEKKTLLEIVCSIADQQSMANYSMLFLWASLANAIPITFWTLTFMLRDKNIWDKARQEVDKVLKTSTNVKEADLRQMPYIRCCMLEAIRLRSPGVITRRVVKSFTVKGMVVPEGDRLMISPYWAHRNTKYFPEPEKFKPDRWQSVDVDKNTFLPGFVAFGGGRYQCPGRWFALLEIHMYLALFIQRYNCKLLDPVPEPSSLHVVGTQQPSGPCSVQYSLRQSA